MWKYINKTLDETGGRTAAAQDNASDYAEKLVAEMKESTNALKERVKALEQHTQCGSKRSKDDIDELRHSLMELAQRVVAEQAKTELLDNRVGGCEDANKNLQKLSLVDKSLERAGDKEEIPQAEFLQMIQVHLDSNSDMINKVQEQSRDSFSTRVSEMVQGVRLRLEMLEQSVDAASVSENSEPWAA